MSPAPGTRLPKPGGRHSNRGRLTHSGEGAHPSLGPTAAACALAALAAIAALAALAAIAGVYAYHCRLKTRDEDEGSRATALHTAAQGR
eukprot:2770199-Prymnesium_polylepis.1